MDTPIIPELPRYIDSTMISAFRSCPQKFYKEFILGLRPAALSIDLHAGAVFASTLEHVYRAIYTDGLELKAAMLSAYRFFLSEWGDVVPLKNTPKTRENVWAAIESYFDTYPPLTDQVQPYIVNGKPAFEFTFAIPLMPATPDIEARNGIGLDGFPLHPSGDPFIYSGRFDMLGDIYGRPCVRDEKTTTSIGSNWADQWNLRSQFSGYVWACQQSGLDLDTVVVRGIGILKTMTHQVQAIKQYSAENVARWHEQLRRDLWRLRRMWDEGYWDYNLADACTSYGGCAFRDLCNSPNEANWYGNYTVRRWNPLQKNPIEERPAA